jgi:MraZ protein
VENCGSLWGGIPRAFDWALESPFICHDSTLDDLGDGQLFQGRFEHNLDEKGRLAIPSSFRGLIQGSEELVITIGDQCLAGYLPEIWQQKIDKISKLNQLDPKVIAFKRIFVGCAQFCPIDRSGRILIPNDLRTEARIERKAMILGQIDKLEFWNVETWAQTFAQLTDQVGSICGALAEHGVSL